MDLLMSKHISKLLLQAGYALSGRPRQKRTVVTETWRYCRSWLKKYILGRPSRSVAAAVTFVNHQPTSRNAV